MCKQCSVPNLPTKALKRSRKWFQVATGPTGSSSGGKGDRNRSRQTRLINTTQLWSERPKARRGTEVHFHKPEKGTDCGYTCIGLDLFTKFVM